MASLTLRSVKGTPLTNSEVDANFSNLNTELATKQATLVSGTSIKTVNGQSVLGSGNIQIDGGVTSFNTRTGAVTLSSGDVTGALGFTPFASSGGSIAGGLDFSGTGRRITGDLSNATHSNRLLFQSSTANANSQIGIIPNGTAVNAAYFAYNSSDPTNASTALMRINAGEMALISGAIGTGTFLPMAFLTNNSERGRITTTGNWLFNTTTDNGTDRLQVNGSVSATSFSGSGANLTGLTSSQITTALGFTPYNSTNPSGYITNTGNARVGVENNGTLIGTRRNINFIPGAGISLSISDDAANEEVDITITSSAASGVTSFNTRTGAVTLSSGDVTTALGYTPLSTGGGSLSGDLQLGGNFLRFDQSGTRSWNIRATGGNLDVNSGDGSGSLRYNNGVVLTSNNYNSYALPLSGGTLAGSVSFAQGANINFGTSTNESGPWTISVIGSGGATPATKGTGRGRNLIIQAGASDNGAGLAGGDMFVRGGNPTSPSVVYGDVRIADLGGQVYLRSGEIALGSSNYSSYALPLSGGTLTGSNSSSTPILAINVSGSGPWQRGVRMLNSGMAAGDSLMYAVGQADNARNMGQFYFYYAGSGSTSNRLSAGLHSVDDVFNIFGSGNVMIGTTSDSGHKFNVSGTMNSTGALTQAGNQVLHAGNYTSYSPSLGGSGASGTWGISISGSSNSTTFVSSPDGDRTAGNKLPTSNPRTVRFDFANASSVGSAGNFAGVMTYAPWDGTSASTGDSSYQLAFTNQSGVNASGPAQLLLRNGINSSWNGWQTILSSSNYTSYALAASGSSQSGLWLFNNMGNNHGTYTNFNSVPGFGAYYVQQGNNGPTGVAANQFYGFTLGLGNEYPLSQYGTQLYWPRRAQNSETYVYVRDIEGGAWTSWTKIRAGYADSAGSATSASSASSVSGLTINNSGAPINPDNVTQNQIGYNTSVSLFGQSDGGLYSSSYSSSWIHQIYGDFRTGQIAIRGKNSGTWQGWRAVLDSSNYSSYAVPLSGGTMSGQLTIRNGSPTIYLQDTDNRSAMIHVNSNIFYVLRGSGADSTSWAQVNGLWPLEISLETNNAVFGGNVTAYSDDRIKSDWAPLAEDFVSRLANVKNGTFTRIDTHERQIGVSAQSLQDVAPEGVLEGKYLSVAYGNVALASAVELAKEVVDLRNRVAQLESLINKLIGD